MEGFSKENPGDGSAWTRRLVNGISVVCLLLALAIVITIVGWPVQDSQLFWLRTGTRCTVGLFLLQEVLRMVFRRESILRRFVKHWFESLLFCAALVMVVAYAPMLSGLMAVLPDVAPFTVRLGYAAGLNALILWVLMLRGIRFRHSVFKGVSLTPGRVFILSFVLLIAAGTLLLKTPNASSDGISWCDALFLSTSAVCVTGLSPFDVATELTFNGLCILLVLIQLGGLGVMTITYFFAYFFAGGLSLKNRFDFQDLFSEENMGQIGMVLAVMVGFTFAAEAIGAVAIYLSTAGTEIAAANPIFFAVFHSVSGFCNAGLSCVPGGMTNPELSQSMTMISSLFVMAIIGGLGFPVIRDFWMFFLNRLRTFLWSRKIRHVPVRLTTHTKIVLVTSFGLIVFGFVAFYVLDWASWGGDSLRRAFFLAGTSRTAGFDIGPTSDITPAAKVLLMALMFIGGSPFSTAGGIKTTTFAIAVLSLRQYVLGRRDLEVFGRRLDSDFANQALAIVLLGATAVFVVTVSLCILHPQIDFLSLAFESVSAVGTVGLSCGVTPQLGEPGKYLLAGTMFVGRIGILLFITSFLPRRKTPAAARLPETTIVLS